jgi:hypothetical protein
MDPHVIRIARGHPVATVMALVCVVALLCTGLSRVAAWAGYAVFALRLDAGSARTRSSVARTVPVLLTVPFRGVDHEIRVRVPETEVAAARALPTEPVFNSEAALRRSYVSRLVRHEARGRAVEALVGELRRLRTRLDLDDDAYLELMTCTVQAIPYGTPRWRIEPPAALLAQGRGVCSDKSVLLAAMLLHEGYDTSVWVFAREHHVAVGVRGAGSGFRGSGYAFVETTRRSYVGDDGDYLVRRTGSWEAQRIGLGGTRRYASDLEAAFVLEYGRRARTRSRLLEPYRGFERSGSAKWRPYYAQRAAEQEVTSAMARCVEAGIGDRAALYRLLTRAGSAR